MASSSSSTSEYPKPNLADFVSVKLSKSNYILWRAQMWCFIQCQELTGLVDGTTPSPSQLTYHSDCDEFIVNPDYPAWQKMDRLVKGWILGSLTDDVLDSVLLLDTAFDVWTKLKNDFAPSQYIFDENPKITAVGMIADQDELSIKDVSWHLPLYKAALGGDWDSARKIIDENPEALTAAITKYNDTVLHIAVQKLGTHRSTKRHRMHFVENLVARMPAGALALRTAAGVTAFVLAAVTGNKKAATLLLNKNRDLLYIGNIKGILPVQFAAFYSQRDTLSLLLEEIIKDDKQKYSPFAVGQSAGISILNRIIDVEFFDLALKLLERYPHLAYFKIDGISPLQKICQKPSAFKSGSNRKFWESLIYYCVPIDLHEGSSNSRGSDVENPTDRSSNYSVQLFGRNFFRKMLHVVVWYIVKCLFGNIQREKLHHRQALQLVQYLCKLIASLNHRDSCLAHFNEPILLAAKLGIHEAVEEIVGAFPETLRAETDSGQNLIQLAVRHRCAKVFNLLYQTNEVGIKLTFAEKETREAWHFAGKLAPLEKLNLVSGAALQMQREIQWFNVMEKFMCTPYKSKSSELLKDIFTEEHNDLVTEGQKWMKDLASSYSIAAALIVTITFAAVITVPGGNAENGLPIFSGETTFRLFVISDAISLFTSTTSLLMCLSILTARYAEEDFLYSLPKKLIIGLSSLIVSIASMMVAFSATLFMVIGEETGWTLIPIAALACLPVASFTFLQFPLLLNVIYSTYGRKIFGKQSETPHVPTIEVV